MTESAEYLQIKPETTLPNIVALPPFRAVVVVEATVSPDWQDLQSIIAVTAKRDIGDKVSEETRYFISSLNADDPQRLERVVRAHWAQKQPFATQFCWVRKLTRNLHNFNLPLPIGEKP